VTEGESDALAPIDVMDPPVPPNGAAMIDVGEFIGPGEIKALQTAIRAHVEVLRSALQRCATAGTFSPDKSPADWEAWQSVKTRTTAYLAEDPAWLGTVAQYERGERLQKELGGWHVKTKELGCDAGPAPPMPPEPDTPILSTAGLTQTGLILIAILWLIKSDKL
jgi:hypothetical protein